MADLVRNTDDLNPFVLSNVRLTGVKIGAGSYGSVDEVAIPGAICAAKRIHDIFLDRSKVAAADIRRSYDQFVRECRLMSNLRHPHVVQFIGVCFFPGSELPALVMERLSTCVHDLLDSPTLPNTPKKFLPLSLKCSILQNVAEGLEYLHDQSPPIIHRDLSAKNVLLNAQMVAKIADLGMARIMPHMRAAATMTKAPGATIYMPPEATASTSSTAQKSKYDASIDVFSLGVLTIFIIGETFPCDLPAHNYTDENSGMLVARTELQRRSEYMRDVNAQLRECGQLRGDHPLIRLIQQCLHNNPARRPGIHEVLRLLEEARAGTRDNEWEQLQALQIQPRNQENEVLQQLVQAQVMELAQKEEQLQSSERERLTIREELSRKEVELTMAEETIRREHQQIEDKCEIILIQETELVKVKVELAQAQDQLKQTKEQLQSSEVMVAELMSLLQRDSEITQTNISNSTNLVSQQVQPTTVLPQANNTSSTSPASYPVKPIQTNVPPQTDTPNDNSASQPMQITTTTPISDSVSNQIQPNTVLSQTSTSDTISTSLPIQNTAQTRTTTPIISSSSQMTQSTVQSQTNKSSTSSRPLLMLLNKIRAVVLPQSDATNSSSAVQPPQSTVVPQTNTSFKMTESDVLSQLTMRPRSKSVSYSIQKRQSTMLPETSDTTTYAAVPLQPIQRIVVPQPRIPRTSQQSATLPRTKKDKNSASQRDQIKVQCHPMKKVPCKMVRGSVTTDHKFAYFAPKGSKSIYSYEFDNKKWEPLPPRPYRNSSLVMIDGALTTVGGEEKGSACTDKLFTLRQMQWVEEYPPMNTARFEAAVVSSSDGHYVFVIGGNVGDLWITTVELFLVQCKQWHKLTSLRLPHPYPSATICGNQIFVVGEENGYVCSLQALFSDVPITSQSTQRLISWTPLPRLPVKFPTATILSGELAIIGGMRAGELDNSIHQLVDREWVEIDSMSSAKKWCLVVSQSPNKVIIVGGRGERFELYRQY